MQTPADCVTFQINEDYSVEIKKYEGSYGSEYYNVNGINYDIHFPIEWVFQHPSDTEIPSFGPEECNLCAEYGYLGGVFIGYCLHCAKNADYKRGNGMISIGVEIDQVEANKLGISVEYKEENSMWNVYMQTVDPSQIGDETLLTKHMSFFHHQIKKGSNQMERFFDYRGWLNISLAPYFYTSEEEEDISLNSFDGEPLTLVLPKTWQNVSKP